MSSIGSVGNSMMQGMHGSGHRRPDPAAFAEKLFSQLDSDSQGYIEQSDLQAAFSQIGASDESSGSSDLFKQLDSDGDGKVTKDEFTSALETISQQLDSQFDQMRMGGMQGAGQMPPPPPPADDAGFTKGELQSQLTEIGSSDSRRSSLISDIVNNFDAADSDGDGKVSFQEAMGYDKSKGTASADSGTAATRSTESNDGMRLMMQIMRLAEAYGLNRGDSSTASTTLQASA